MKNVGTTLRNWSRNYNKDGSSKYVDPSLWIIVFALLAAGLVMVYSSSYIFAQERFKDGLFFFKRHLIFMGAGVAAFLVAWRLPIEWLKKAAVPALLSVMFLLALTLIPGIAHKSGGAARWISIAGFTFQPSELAKLAVILFVSLQLSRKVHKQHNFASGFLTYFVATIPLYILLLLQPDFGTTALCVATTVFMLIAGGIRLRYLLPAIGGIIPLGATLIVTSPYRMKRVLAFLDPWSDPAHKGFQVIQSFLAFYSGKLFGVGLGNSREKLFYLPEAHNDFIFAVVGEELGLVGVIFFVSLFTALVFKGLKTLQNLDDTFERGLCAGITCMVGLQAFFNMAVVLGLLPTKGLPLPLISYGGTSLIVCLFLLGILAQLSEKK